MASERHSCVGEKSPAHGVYSDPSFGTSGEEQQVKVCHEELV